MSSTLTSFLFTRRLNKDRVIARMCIVFKQRQLEYTLK